MAKKKSDKETEPKKVSTKRFSAFLKNETTHFVIGLISVIFAVYLLLAFTSFFFTGAADQSILDNQQPGELMQTANHVKNYAGARGAQLAEFLINECFGLAAYFIILFLAVVGMKLMKAYSSVSGNGLCPVLSCSSGSLSHWDLFLTAPLGIVLSIRGDCTDIM